MNKIFVTDTTLRDGMHTIRHQFTPRQMQAIARALDEAGMDIIEIGHGDGLSGSSYQYGWAAATDAECVQACVQVVKRAKLAVLLVPGIGTKDDLDQVADLGVTAVRVATHCTEADIAEQHIGLGKRRGLFVVAFLMMAHANSPEGLAEQARMMEAYGADVVYVTDSAGALLPDDVRARVATLRNAIDVPVGFHAHNNLGLAIGNTLAAISEGATYVDGSLRGFGAGAGNAQTEVLIGVLHKAGYTIQPSFLKVLDAAECLAKEVEYTPHLDNEALIMGYAGVYSSFLRHAEHVAQRFGIDPRELLLELGNQLTVGGQEDALIDVAYQITQRRQRLSGDVAI